MDGTHTNVSDEVIGHLARNGGNIVRIPDTDLLTTGHFTSMQELKTYLAESIHDIMLIHMEDLQAGRGTIPRFTFQTATQSLTVMAVRFPATGIPGLNAPCNVIVLACPVRFCTYLRGAQIRTNVGVLASPEDSFHGIVPRNLPSGGRELVRRAPVFVMYGSDSDLVRYFETEGISMDEKVRATLFHLYPYLRDEFKKDYNVMTYDEVIREKSLTPQDPFEETDNTVRQKFLWVTAMCVLSPFYSQANEMGNQIHKRGQAATASLHLDWGSLTDFEGYKRERGLVPTERNPMLDKDLGRWLARDEHFTWNPNITKANLATLDSLMTRFEIDPWAVSLLEQGRMVGERSHATTLSFAISVEELLRPSCPQLGEPWASQSILLQNLSSLSKEQPYSGLVYNLPEGQRIASWPDFAYLGVLHYRNCLPDDKKEKFNTGYSISGVASQVGSDAARFSCEELAKTLPSNNTVGIGNLIKSVPLAQARLVMDDKSDDVKLIVLKYLDTQDPKGAWYEFHRNVLVTRELVRVRNVASGIIKDVIKEKTEAALSAAEELPTPVERRAEKARVSEWARGKYQLLLGDNPIQAAAGEAALDMMTEANREEVHRLSDLMATIVVERV